jgi:hypothetical protein
MEDNNVVKPSLATVLVEPGSLLVFSDHAYEKYLHTIKEMAAENFKFGFRIRLAGDSPNEVTLVETGGLDNLGETRFWSAV